MVSNRQIKTAFGLSKRRVYLRETRQAPCTIYLSLVTYCRFDSMGGCKWKKKTSSLNHDIWKSSVRIGIFQSTLFWANLNESANDGLRLQRSFKIIGMYRRSCCESSARAKLFMKPTRCELQFFRVYAVNIVRVSYDGLTARFLWKQTYLEMFSLIRKPFCNELHGALISEIACQVWSAASTLEKSCSSQCKAQNQRRIIMLLNAALQTFLVKRAGQIFKLLWSQWESTRSYKHSSVLWFGFGFVALSVIFVSILNANWEFNEASRTSAVCIRFYKNFIQYNLSPTLFIKRLQVATHKKCPFRWVSR